MIVVYANIEKQKQPLSRGKKQSMCKFKNTQTQISVIIIITIARSLYHIVDVTEEQINIPIFLTMSWSTVIGSLFNISFSVLLHDR